MSASLLNAGRDVEEVVGVLLEATQAAAGEIGTRWNWRLEEARLRRMCSSWLAKHPPPKRPPPPPPPPDDQPPDDPIDLGEARAKAKRKTKMQATALHIVLAEAVLAVIRSRGEDLPYITGFASGWHTHLDHLSALLEGVPRPPFWPAFTRRKAEYEKLIPAD